MLIYLRKWVILGCISVFMSLRLLEPNLTAVQSPLVIGVLSAQNNFAARASIRKTWKTLVNSNYKFFFIVGNEFCPIHPADRKSDLTCESLRIPPVFDQQYSDPTWTPKASPRSRRTTGATITSFTFHVNFPVMVRGFRVWQRLFQMSSLLTMNLKNARTGTLVTSASFLRSTSTNTSWLEVETKPFVLPKSFDAELQLLAENATFNDQTIPTCFGQSSWFNFSEAIEFTTQYKVGSGWCNFDQEACSPMSVSLQLHDLETVLSEKHTRRLEWDRQIKSMSQRLRNEAHSEQDILFVDVLDVYRNIPDKLLSFYTWVSKNLNFSFLLKADDDTFLNIPAIEKYLKSLGEIGANLKDPSEMWWWGRLRHGLPVERHGKWQELLYAAPVYPPFLCGGGYILNENIVKFLATNSRWLHRFQGEDTSLGIWLSGVHPQSPKNATCHWVCAKECDKDSCNRGQLSPDNMLTVWQHFQETQSLC